VLQDHHFLRLCVRLERMIMKNEMMVFEGREVEVFEFDGQVLFIKPANKYTKKEKSMLRNLAWKKQIPEN